MAGCALSAQTVAGLRKCNGGAGFAENETSQRAFRDQERLRQGHGDQ